MISALISFLGGSVFRMLWGEISSWMTARQDHAHELARLRLQAEIDQAQHERNLAAIRLQHDMGVDVVRVQGEAQIGGIEAEAWLSTVKATAAQTGIWLVDLWNGIIRPFGATLCLGLVVLHFYRHNWVLDEQGWGLIGAFLGIYVADRSLFKRGK